MSVFHEKLTFKKIIIFLKVVLKYRKKIDKIVHNFLEKFGISKKYSLTRPRGQ